MEATQAARQPERFDFSSGALCLDFANTVDWRRDDERRRDWLRGYRDLVEWARQAGLVSDDEARRLLEADRGDPAAGAGVLQRAVALREAIYQAFSTLGRGGRPDAADLALLNQEVGAALAHLRVAPVGDGFGWDWEDRNGSPDRMLWPVARSAAELLTSGDLHRIRECGWDPCGWLFLDRSRNRSRRWCDMAGCGNRAKAKRHYQRRRDRTAGAGQ